MRTRKVAYPSRRSAAFSADMLRATVRRLAPPNTWQWLTESMGGTVNKREAHAAGIRDGANERIDVDKLTDPATGATYRRGLSAGRSDRVDEILIDWDRKGRP